MKKNTVRILALVLVALMCLSLIPLAAHAEAHVHEMATDHLDPTCVDNGFDQVYCPICNTTFSMNYIPPTGEHSFIPVEDEEYMIEEGDCTHPYQYWKSCSVCKQSAEEAYGLAVDKMVEELNARKQSGEQADWETVAKDRILLLDERYKFSAGGEGHHIIRVDHQEATCTSDGWKDYTYCDVCGEYFNYEAIPAKGHRWTEFTVTKAPTCTEDGSRERVCEVCDQKEIQAIPALGHTWTAFKVTKAATCTEDGSQERTCTVCGEKEIEVIPAAHKFGEFVVIEEPTCYAAGTKEHTCTVCGYKETESIPAAHKWGEFVVTQEPTCYSTGAQERVCAVCGETEAEWIDMAHKYENGVCVYCGEAQPDGAPSVSEPAQSEESAAFKTEEAAEEPAEEVTEPAEEAAVLDNAIYISFDGNGATSGSMEAQAFEPGTSQNLSLNAFVRPGYKFVGWDTMADGTGMGDEPYFADGDVVTLNSPVTLYAQWVEDPEAAAENTAEETATYDLGVTQIGIYLDPNGSPVSEAKVGDVLTVKVTPESSAYNYQWYRIEKEGQDPVVLSDGSSNKYELTRADVPYHVNCSVYEDDPLDAMSADNSVHVRLDVPFPVTVKGIGSVVTTNEDKPNFKEPVSITYDPNNGMPNPFEIGALTENEVSLMVTPSSGYLIRYVKENSTTVIPASRNAKTFTINSVQKSQENHKFEVYFDNYEIRISAEQAILPSDISTENNPDIKQSFMDAYVNKLGLDPEDYSAYYYVTPCWKGTPAAPISDTDISAIGSLSFSLDMPSEVTPENYDNFEIHVYHYVKDTNTWENVSFSKEYVTEDGVDKVKAKIENFSNFSPFAIVAIPSVKLEYDANGGSGEMDAKTTLVGNTVTVDSPTFTAPIDEINNKNKTFETWKDIDGNEYEVGKEITLTKDLKLYAQWKDGYTIIFDANDSNNPDTYGALVEGNMDPLYVTEGETVTISNKYHLKNHEQLGWSETPGAGNTPDPKYNSTFIPEQDLTLYAVWKRTQISITFNSNGGSGNMADQPAAIGGSVPLNKNTYTAPYSNLEFAGWSDTVNGNIKYQDQQIIDIPETDLSLFAVWREKKNIHFMPGEGTGNEYIQAFSSGVDTKLDEISKMEFTAPKGFVFEKWNNKNDGTGDVSYKDGAVLKNPSAELYLFAQWTKNTCDITFDANGGIEDPEKPMGTQTVTKGTATPLKENTFIAPENCIFNGWKDGNGNPYNDKASFTAMNDQDEVTLYAQWKKVWTIKFDSNSSEATGTMDPFVYEQGTSKNLPANKFSRTNYKMIGWTETQGGTKAQYALGANAPAKNVTLYAVWQREKITLTLNANNKTAPETPDTITKSINKGASYTLPKNTFEYPDNVRTFMGWNTVPDPTEDNPGTSYTDGATIPASATTNNLTLYAQWDYTVTYKNGASDATGSMNTQTFERNKEFALSENEFSRGENYVFNGWKDEEGEEYSNNQKVKFTRSKVLTAQWKQVKYAVSFDPNGGGGTMDSQNVEIGQSVTLKDSTFDPKPNMIFAGWTTEKGGTVAKYAVGDKFQPTGDVTLYAVWKDIIKVYYYPGAGDGSYKIQEIPANTPTALWKYDSTDLGYKAPSGQTFAHWKDKDHNDKIYFDGSKVTLSEDIRLEAVWADTIRISYHPNGGTVTTSSGTKSDAAVFSAPKDTPFALYTANQLRLNRDGYEFKGWAMTASSKEVRYEDGETVTFSSDTTLYAVWEQHIFTGIVTITGSLSGGQEQEIGFVGETLTANVTGEKLFTNYSYKWLRDGTAITGATSETYVPTAADFGCVLTCEVTAEDALEDKTRSSINYKFISIEEEDKNIVNNGQTETDNIYGVYPGMYYSINNGAKQQVTVTNGVFTVTQQGIYRFYKDASSNVPVATVNVINWWTIGYSLSTGSGDGSGSGTVTFKRGSTTLSSSTTIRDSAGNVILQPYSLSGYTNVWIVRQDAGITDITMTVKPGSGSYGHVALNNGSYDSSSSERTFNLGTITQAMLYNVVFNKSSSSPRTADMSHLGLWSALCLTSFVGAATILGSARKRKKDQA